MCINIIFFKFNEKRYRLKGKDTLASYSAIDITFALWYNIYIVFKK